MRGRLLLFVGICATMVAVNAHAANRKVTVTGSLDTTARGDVSLLRTSDEKQYQFDPVSKIGKKIWNVCDREALCTVTGTVDKYDIFVSVTKVKKGPIGTAPVR